MTAEEQRQTIENHYFKTGSFVLQLDEPDREHRVESYVGEIIKQMKMLELKYTSVEF